MLKIEEPISCNRTRSRGFWPPDEEFSRWPIGNSAVGEKPGTLPFFLNTSTRENSFQEGSSKKEVTVNVQTLDEIMDAAFPEGKFLFSIMRPKVLNLNFSEELLKRWPEPKLSPLTLAKR